MKKLLLIAVVIVTNVFSFAQRVNAQKAFGLRLGDGDFFVAEASYLTALNTNRFELDLGIGGIPYWLFISTSGSYQWNWNIVGGFYWYAGPAAQVNFLFSDYADISLGLGVQIGLEYDFSELNVPILASFDFRPLGHYYLLDNYDYPYDAYRYFGWSIAIGARYIF